MTASVGVGKATEDMKAKRHIEKVLANMDAEMIVTVTENIMELKKYVNIPKQSMCDGNLISKSVHVENACVRLKSLRHLRILGLCFFNGNSYIKLHFFCLRTIQGDEKRERPLWNSSAQTDGCYRKVHEKFKM